MECEYGWKATALKTYLLERLRHLSLKQGEYKMQRTMLCTWLTELFLRGFTYLPLDPGTGENGDRETWGVVTRATCSFDIIRRFRPRGLLSTGTRGSRIVFVKPHVYDPFCCNL